MSLDPRVAAWLEARVGAVASDPFFEANSMSAVWGVELADGRRVAVKRRGGAERLAIVARAHRAALAAGIDTPALLAGPDHGAGPEHGAGPDHADGDAWLTVEQWRPEGATVPDGDAPELYARLLARLIAALASVDASGLTPPPWLDFAHTDPGRVWPPAASDRWDPHRIESHLPPQVPAYATAARARLLASDLPPVLGHADLNGLNVRWVGDHGIVHDWDSIAHVPEAVLVGVLAADHPSTPDAGAIADIATGARVISAYEAAVARRFTRDELEVAWAASTWIACYNAAFEHLHGAPGAVSAAIVRDGAERLSLASA